MLKDAAINWVRANCTDLKLRADLSRKLKDVLQRRVECWFAVGGALTRERVPYMIHCFASELFIFQLSEAQAASLMVAPDALMCNTDPNPTPVVERVLPLAISLSNFELDKPTLTANGPVTGSIAYEIEGETTTSYCLRLDCLMWLRGDQTSWNIPEQILHRSGRIRFSFELTMGLPWPFLPQWPAVVFLRVCTLPSSGEVALRRAISNTCGSLIEVEGNVAGP